jgi:hypothetical protein
MSERPDTPGIPAEPEKEFTLLGSDMPDERAGPPDDALLERGIDRALDPQELAYVAERLDNPRWRKRLGELFLLRKGGPNPVRPPDAPA